MRELTICFALLRLFVIPLNSIYNFFYNYLSPRRTNSIGCSAVWLAVCLSAWLAILLPHLCWERVVQHAVNTLSSLEQFLYSSVVSSMDLWGECVNKQVPTTKRKWTHNHQIGTQVEFVDFLADKEKYTRDVDCRCYHIKPKEKFCMCVCAYVCSPLLPEIYCQWIHNDINSQVDEVGFENFPKSSPPFFKYKHK